jgi:hypothetical protein
MSALSFFAAREDQIALLSFLFQDTDVEVFESYSPPDQKLRRFRSVAELDAAFELGVDRHGNQSTSLLLRSPAVMPRLRIERIALDPRRCKGAVFRETLDGGALIQLELGGVHKNALSKCYYNHNSRERAQKWGVDNGIDWLALTSLSRRVHYQIRKKLAVDRVPGRPILRQAADLWGQGLLLKEGAYSPDHWTYEGLRPDA